MILCPHIHKILYVYDFMNMWTFYVEFIEEAKEIDSIIYPRIIFSAGTPPEKAPEKTFEKENTEDENDLEDDQYHY